MTSKEASLASRNIVLSILRCVSLAHTVVFDFLSAYYNVYNDGDDHIGGYDDGGKMPIMMFTMMVTMMMVRCRY